MKLAEVIYFGFELDLLEAHLENHKYHEGRLIVVECEHTTTGVPKPLMFKENQDRFSRFNVEHMVFPGSTFPIQTKTFNEFKHQDSNAKKIMQKYLSLETDWVFHSDTDEILDLFSASRLQGSLALMDKDTRCVHHHLWQRSPYINIEAGLFHVHRIHRAGAEFVYPKAVKRQVMPDTKTNDGVNPIGWHFTNCFSNPFELYWKIKTRNWLVPEQTLEFCQEVFRLGFDNLQDPKFDCISPIFPESRQKVWANELPNYMTLNQDHFPLWSQR